MTQTDRRLRGQYIRRAPAKSTTLTGVRARAKRPQSLQMSGIASILPSSIAARSR
jgi:hypothetical protein